MECQDEDGVRYDSFDSDLQKCMVSFTRQGPMKEKSRLGRDRGLVCKMGYSIRSLISDANRKLLYIWGTQRRGQAIKE